MTFAPDYNDVPARIRQFREKHPDGTLQAYDKMHPYRIETIGGETFVVYVAAAYRSPDDLRPGIGVAWEPVPGKTPFTRGSEIQNAETSAWGRAIIAVGAGDAKRISSDEEIAAARRFNDAPTPPAPKARVEAVVALAETWGLADWVKEQHFRWPYTADVCDAIEAAVDEIRRNEQETP